MITKYWKQKFPDYYTFGVSKFMSKQLNDPTLNYFDGQYSDEDIIYSDMDVSFLSIM